MARRFTATGERYDAPGHATTYTAELVEGPDHIVTREHTWTDRFGPVPGTHYVAYTCTCGGRYRTYERPHSQHLDALQHHASPEAREAHEAAEAADRAVILRTLGMDEEEAR
jgi:hypothetical protein